jgi:hypothetical protein
MNHNEIVTRLSMIWHTDESIWGLYLSSVYSEIVRRMSHNALKLTASELELARDEVKAAL